MAKLTGVKTLDMKDGVIERVEYDGATYTRVEGTARFNRKAGDLFLNEYKHRDITMGAFYALGDYGNIRDDAGDIHGNALSAGILYRKVEPVLFFGGYAGVGVNDFFGASTFVNAVPATTPTLNERLSDVEARVDKLEQSEAGPDGNHGFANGEIVTILRKASIAKPAYRVENARGSQASVATVDIVKATDAEVAEAKAAQAKAEAERKLVAKWVAIGRKVNEYRVGDIVVSTGGSNGHAKGVYGEIVRDDDSGFPIVKGFSGERAGSELWTRVNLITPVEARFDRN